MKFTEREFWAALCPAVVGLLTVIGVIGDGDQPLVQAITGVVLIVGPATAYIVARIWQKVEVAKAEATVKVEQAKAGAKIAMAAAQGPTPSSP